MTQLCLVEYKPVPHVCAYGLAIIPEIPKFPVKSDNDNMGSIYPYESYCVHCGA